MIQAVLFDLDGCLVDAAPIHYAALNAALVAHGYTPISLDDHKFEMDGLPTLSKLGRLVGKGIVRREDVESIRALKQKNTAAAIKMQVQFDPTIFCVISGLRHYGAGIKWGIVTNAIGDTVFEVSRILHLPFPNVLVTNEEATPKPSPAPYELAASRLGLRTADCLAVEDGHYGIESATAAGCRVMKVSRPKDVTPEAIWKELEEPCGKT